MPSQFDNGNELSFIPQQPLVATIFGAGGLEFMSAVDGTVADFWRIDWCSLVTSYDLTSLNYSGELCLGTSPTDLFPLLATAAHATPTAGSDYFNKYTDKNEQPFFITSGYGFWLRTEQSGPGGSSSTTGFVGYSLGFLATG